MCGRCIPPFRIVIGVAFCLFGVDPSKGRQQALAVCCVARPSLDHWTPAQRSQQCARWAQRSNHWRVQRVSRMQLGEFRSIVCYGRRDSVPATMSAHSAANNVGNSDGVSGAYFFVCCCVRMTGMAADDCFLAELRDRPEQGVTCVRTRTKHINKGCYHEGRRL